MFLGFLMPYSYIRCHRSGRMGGENKRLLCIILATSCESAFIPKYKVKINFMGKYRLLGNALRDPLDPFIHTSGK